MERLENVKEFFLAHKYVFMIGGCLVLGISIYFGYQTLVKQEKVTLLEGVEKYSSMIDSSKENEVETEKICQLTVDIKGEVKSPGLYQLDCGSRIKDIIDMAGGVTWKADTSVLNLSKKLVDEMVVIVYSKEQVANFVVTKAEEGQKQETCWDYSEVKNDACIDSDMLDSSATDSIIGDTPVDNTISLNSASKEDLMSLPGIGESKAVNIINYRNENGDFQSIEEIKNVKGIGDSVFEKIKANITV